MRTPRREPKAPVNRHRIPTPSPSASPSGGADEPRPFRMRATRDKHRPSPSPSPQPPQPASPAPASKEVSDKAAPSVGDGAVKAGDGNVKASDGEVKAGANNLQPPSKPGVAATPVPKRGTITRSTSPNPFMSSKDKGKGRANGGSQQPSPNMGYSRGLVALPIPFGDTLSLSAVLAPTSVDSATLPPASVPSVKPPTIGRIDVAATIAASSFDLAIAITAPTPVTATPADVGPIVEPAPAPSPAPIAQPHPPPPSPSISLRTVSNPLPAGSPSNNASGHKRSISLGSPFRPKTQRKANPSPSPSTPPRPTNFHPQAQQPSPVQLNPVQPNPPHLGTATVSAQFIGTGNSGPHGHFEPTPNGGYHNQWGPHHSNQPVLYPPGRAAPNQRAPPPFGSDQSRPSQAFSLFPTQHANVQVDASGQHYVLVNDEAGHQVGWGCIPPIHAPRPPPAPFTPGPSRSPAAMVTPGGLHVFSVAGRTPSQLITPQQKPGPSPSSEPRVTPGGLHVYSELGGKPSWSPTPQAKTEGPTNAGAPLPHPRPSPDPSPRVAACGLHVYNEHDGNTSRSTTPEGEAKVPGDPSAPSSSSEGSTPCDCGQVHRKSESGTSRPITPAPTHPPHPPTTLQPVGEQPVTPSATTPQPLPTGPLPPHISSPFDFPHMGPSVDLPGRTGIPPMIHAPVPIFAQGGIGLIGIPPHEFSGGPNGVIGAAPNGYHHQWDPRTPSPQAFNSHGPGPHPPNFFSPNPHPPHWGAPGSYDPHWRSPGRRPPHSRGPSPRLPYSREPSPHAHTPQPHGSLPPSGNRSRHHSPHTYRGGSPIHPPPPNLPGPRNGYPTDWEVQLRSIQTENPNVTTQEVFDIMFCDWMQPLNTSPMMVNLRQFMKGFIETLNPLYFVAAALVFRIIFHLPESPSAADERFKHAHRTVMRMAPELLRHFGDKCDNCGRRGFVGCWFFLPFSDRHCIQCGTGRPCSHDPAISGM